jgi:hypothetical protein
MFLLGAVDLCLALALGLGFWFVFGVFAVGESNPPICANYFGHSVDCSLEGPMDLARYVLFGVLFAGLLAFHAFRRPHVTHGATEA